MGLNPRLALLNWRAERESLPASPTHRWTEPCGHGAAEVSHASWPKRLTSPADDALVRPHGCRAAARPSATMKHGGLRVASPLLRHSDTGRAGDARRTRLAAAARV